MKITIKKLKQIIKEEMSFLHEHGMMAPMNEDTCPCGIERADCEYHKPEQQTSSLKSDIEYDQAFETYRDIVMDCWWENALIHPKRFNINDPGENKMLEDYVEFIANKTGLAVDIVRDIIYEFAGFNNP